VKFGEVGLKLRQQKKFFILQIKIIFRIFKFTYHFDVSATGKRLKEWSYYVI